MGTADHATTHQRQVFKVLGDALAQLAQGDAVVEADADACRVRCQAQHIKTRAYVRSAPCAAVHCIQQSVHGTRAAVWVVFGWLTKDIDGGCFKVRVTLCPEHGGRIPT